MHETRFRVGDVVSCGYAVGLADPIVGRVIELRRKADGRPFLMIAIESGPKAGTRTFPDVAWQLGVGPEPTRGCDQCGRQYRTRRDDGTLPGSCYRCSHLDETEARRRSADPERRATSWERRQRGSRAS